MRKHNGRRELWPAAKTSWHHNWGVWFASELQYSQDVTELLDVFDI